MFSEHGGREAALKAADAFKAEHEQPVPASGQQMQVSTPGPSRPQTARAPSPHEEDNAILPDLYFEQQDIRVPLCLQHAFNNVWQEQALILDPAEYLGGADIGLLCDEARLGERSMIRIELDASQLEALQPLLRNQLDRIVVYRGMVELDQEEEDDDGEPSVMGHYTALLRQQGQWWLLDSLSAGPRPVDISRYLAESLVDGTLLAAIPATSSERIVTLTGALHRGAFPYVCGVLGHLFGESQPIGQLEEYLRATINAAPSDVSPAALRNYLAARGVPSALHDNVPLAEQENDIEATLNTLGPQQALIWFRTAPYVAAVTNRNGSWYARMARTDGGHGLDEARPLAECWQQIQGRFDEQVQVVDDNLERRLAAMDQADDEAIDDDKTGEQKAEERKAEIANDRSALSVIAFTGEHPSAWDALWHADAPSHDDESVASAQGREAPAQDAAPEASLRVDSPAHDGEPAMVSTQDLEAAMTAFNPLLKQRKKPNTPCRQASSRRWQLTYTESPGASKKGKGNRKQLYFSDIDFGGDQLQSQAAANVVARLIASRKFDLEIYERWLAKLKATRPSSTRKRKK